VPLPDKVEAHLLPQADGKQPYSKVTKANSMHICANMFPRHSSTTMGPYSASITAAVPHAAVPTPDTYPHPATNQPAPYAAPTASVLFDAPSSTNDKAEMIMFMYCSLLYHHPSLPNPPFRN